MKNNIPTAEELLLIEIKKFSAPLTPEALTLLVINVANQHATNHVEAALKSASEKALTKWASTDFYDDKRVICKHSILKSYPLTNIK